MTEEYRIIDGLAEPLAAGEAGACVRVRLNGYPSSRWSRDFAGRLVNELVGHEAVGHMRLDEIVHTDHIVLAGVEGNEARALGVALRRAIEATNRAVADEAPTSLNMPQEEADAIAAEIARKPA